MKLFIINQLVIFLKKRYQKIPKPLRLYFFIILLFAMLYSACFRRDTTSFILSEDFNRHTVSYFGVLDTDRVESIKSASRIDEPFTIEQYNDNIRPYVDSAASLNWLMADLKSKYQADSILFKNVVDAASIERSDSISSFRNKVLSPYQTRIDSLMALMTVRHDTTALILEGKYVELARLRYDYAVANASVQETILKNYGSFMRDSTSKTLTVLNESLIDQSFTIMNYEGQRMSLSRNISNAMCQYQEYRRRAVRFWSFLYYSICVGTTFSHGDIIPNSRLTRTLSCAELLICIVILAKFIESIKKRE